MLTGVGGTPRTEQDAQELTQAERDKLENERIARARREREALLSGNVQREPVRHITSFFISER